MQRRGGKGCGAYHANLAGNGASREATAKMINGGELGFRWAAVENVGMAELG